MPTVSDRTWRVPGVGRPRVVASAGSDEPTETETGTATQPAAPAAATATTWQVPSLSAAPPTDRPPLPARRQRPPPKPAGPLVVGYVPTSAHAHRPSPQIAARPVPADRRMPSPSGETDPLDGFLAALRRHLSQTEVPVDEAAVDTGDEDTGVDEPAAAVPSSEDDTAIQADEVIAPERLTVDEATPPVTPEAPKERSEREHGDRDRFLAGARGRLANGIPTNPVHPPPIDHDTESVLEPGYANLDPDDLVGTFVQAVEDAGGLCHRVQGDVPDTLLDHLVAELNAWEAVISEEPEAVALGARLAGRGVEVAPATLDTASRAALGVTSAVAGIATTGSVVLDSRQTGGRLASLLPMVHICVLPVERLVATPGDLFRDLGTEPVDLPSSLVIETGPSRTGDIEQLLTLGAHGPTRLHVVLIEPVEPVEPTTEA